MVIFKPSYGGVFFAALQSGKPIKRAKRLSGSGKSVEKTSKDMQARKVT